MLQKTIENLKNLKTASALRETLLAEVKQRTAGIVKVTAAEREKILDNVVSQLLKGEELGDQADAIRAKVRTRLFDKAEGDTLFLNNLKYINEVLTGSLPRSIAELTGFRTTLAHKLAEDARGGTMPSRQSGRREGSEAGGGGGGARRGDHRRGRGHDRPQHAARQGQGGGAERGAPSPRGGEGAYRDGASSGQRENAPREHGSQAAGRQNHSHEQRSQAEGAGHQRPQGRHEDRHTAAEAAPAQPETSGQNQE